jgi:hypothetical protein
MPASVIDELIDKAEMFSGFKEKYYYFFSKSGFTTNSKDRERASENIVLIDFKNMF